ncbi:MAG: MATE family efflux transporter [Fibrobacter sp.]|nr:MATE family efflux transporter [Fibrobacter sp.]
MSSKKRFIINSFAQVFAFLISLGITFFLTPYIVSQLGAAAYGFVGLASNFVGYAQIITIALNSMAGRFITISVHQNRIEDARRYFSSVFFSNIIIVAFVSIIGIIVLAKLECLIDIPPELIRDVKLLFFCIFLNFFISIIFNVYNVSTFIANRLDLSSIRTIIANILKAILLVGSFYLFDAAVWYIGFATIISTIYIICTNIVLKRRLTPELSVSLSHFDKNSIKELLSAGVWNVVEKLSAILSTGFDLLLANLFIGATQMGILAITRRIPTLTLTLFERINSIFAPPWTKLYATDQNETLHRQIIKTLRFFGLISIIPNAFIFAFSDMFYALWLPSQDTKLLYCLTLAACIDLPIAMPLQPIYNLYPITNKVKANSLFSLFTFGLTFVIVFVGLNVTNGTFTHLMIISCTSAAFNIVKALTFLPLYGAHCIKMRAKFLYVCTIRSILSFTVLLSLLLWIKTMLPQASWELLGGCGAATCILGTMIGSLIILNSADRKEIFGLVSKLFH